MAFQHHGMFSLMPECSCLARLQAAQDAADAEAWDAVDMDDLQPEDFADWRDEAFAADGSSTGFFSVSSFSDEYPRDGRGFEPSMLVRTSPCKDPLNVHRVFLMRVHCG